MNKTILVLIGFVFATSSLMAQSERKDSAYQIEAEFPGGRFGWRDYLVNHLNSRLGGRFIKIPKGQTSARQSVIVNFIIDINGNVTNVVADSVSISTIHERLVEEAIRVIKDSPRWTPAWQNGKNVVFSQRQAITFSVSKD